MKLEDKIALITGASRGLGMATARLFHEEGATVIGVGRTRLESREFAERHFDGSERAVYRSVDISKPQAVQGLARFVE
jgi:NAD(P)-dependent dehydrogenase (short-subunit alcohol dehydrogenase family)